MGALETVGKIILIPFMIAYVLMLSKPRHSLKVTLALAGLIVVGFFSATYLIIRNLNFVIYEFPIMDLVYRFINLTVLTVFALILTRQRLVQSIFTTGVVMVIIAVIGVLAMAVLQATGIPEVVTRIVLHVAVGVVIFFVRKPYMELVDSVHSGWWLLCPVPVLLIANFLLLTSIPVSLERNPANMPAALALCVTVVMVGVTFGFVLRSMQRESSLEQNVMAMRLYTSSLEHQNNAAEQNERRTARFRHDMRHIIQMVAVCLDSGDVDGARELLAKMNEGMDFGLGGITIHTFTGLKVLDSALSYYAERAEETGVDFTVRVSPPELPRIDITEFAVVLSNALENALNACLKLPKGERIIRVEGRRQGRQFFLEIANTYAGEVAFDPNTGLPGSRAEGHGVGSQSIAYFVRKCDGTLEYLTQGRWFHLRLLI